MNLCDFNLYTTRHWVLIPQHSNVYGFRLYNNTKYCDYFHRMVLDAKKGEYVDHIDGNPLNNCRDNLRIVTNMENSWNTRAHRDSIHSKFKGVTLYRNLKKPHWTRKKPWLCQILKNGKTKKGYFATEIEAALQYNLWAAELFGEYARFNKID